MSLPAYLFTNKLPKNTQFHFKIVEFGGIQRSILGGPDTYIRRLGDRLQVDVTLPTTEGSLAGDWIGNRAFGYSALGNMRLEIPNFVSVDECGKPIVVRGGGTGGTYVYLDGSSAGLYRNGQLFSYYSAALDCYFMHMVTAFETNNAGFPMIRVAPALRADPVGAVLDFGNPTIQGFISGLDITVSFRRFVGQQFTITEAR